MGKSQRTLDGIVWFRNESTKSWESGIGIICQLGREWWAYPWGKMPKIGPFQKMLHAHVAVLQASKPNPPSPRA